MARLILILSGSLSSTYGGGQVYVRNLLLGFRKYSNLNIQVVSFIQMNKKTDGECQIRSSQFEGYPVVEISGPRQRFLEKLLQITEKFSPDLIHAHGEKELALDCAKIQGIPCVITVHHGGMICPAGSLMDCKDTICHRPVSDRNCLPCVCRNIPGTPFWYFLLRIIPFSIRSKLADFFRKRPFVLFLTPVFTATAAIEAKRRLIEKLKKADRILLPCKKLLEIFQENGIQKNLTILPHAIPEMERSAFPPITDKIRFFYLGRICYVKGLHIMLQAFQGLSPKEYELHIIGGAANKQEQLYLKRLQKKGQSLNLIWHGKVDHAKIPELIRQMHIMIHPTICLEIFGLNIAEALSSGRPVLATCCGGAEMQIQNEVNGWLIPPNDPGAMHQVLKKILENKNNIPMIAKECKKQTPYKEYIERLIKIYHEV